ncbi:hypothetical protein [Vagococcus silagei]|uniref:Uncharacterized protein n=1 Tax=Vagococcus silagei TaxID=2508885 RepID=A0A4S3B5J1_9ENTE|nr:hypothetical protein [Vagococcus silagei]THB61808.1 hypothetical protein ESZ54_03280 [Vagococcus silagei]
MFDQNLKKFQCNHCHKKIESGEQCWTKWQFPPQANAFQDKAIKALEYQNAPILCLECAEKIMKQKY